MHTVPFGQNADTITAAGLGCMGMSGGYGPPDDAESIATIHAALDAGIRLIDTGDFYGMGHNEMLVGEALRGAKRRQAFLSVSFGALRGPDGVHYGYDLRPAAVKNFLTYTLRRLRTDYVDLYQPARYDRSVPIEDTLGAIFDLRTAGYVRHIGLSEVSGRTLRRASAVYPVAALHSEYSLLSRGVERDVLPALRELNIPLIANGVLSRGLISGAALDNSIVMGAVRARMPRFTPGNFARNRALVAALAAIAQARGISLVQLGFAWLRAQGDNIVPLIGARRRAQLAEALAGLRIALAPEELAAIEQAVPHEAVAGARYGPLAMRHLDSELSH
jgi:aryl-alcohol dehydrogenase-like predicted oxidoreductase